MKISEKWLHDWVHPKIDAKQLGDKLTMAGLELDALENLGANKLEHVVVAQVKSLAAHPDAEKLRVCEVDVGQKQLLTIVCGAANVVAGGKFPAALEGAILPNGMTIKPTKLRGVQSNGMLCSGSELGISDNSDGLMCLPEDAPVGEAIFDYLELDDNVLELGLTPNRGDCLSIRGVAREVGVICKVGYDDADYEYLEAQSKRKLPINLLAPEACPRYIGRVIEDVNVAAPTPIWMRERLRRCGIRSISVIVDITNYVLLELGQPMHAFDLAKINGGIQVRMAKPKEKLKLLDGQTVQLDSESLVIADDEKPLALAGIMGGDESAVDVAQTQDILLEAAFFAPIAVAGKARQYGLHTDSSHRFERGVDYELTRTAMEQASTLVVQLAGGKPGPVIEAKHKASLPKPAKIKLRAARIERILGMAVSDHDIVDTLQRLGFEVSAGKPGEWQVMAPSFRFDVSSEIDLIEEIARIQGYQNIPNKPASFSAAIKPKSERCVSLASLQDLLVARGYQEAITYSFVEPGLQQMLSDIDETQVVSLQNPLSADMSVMRTSLFPGLLQTLLYNQNRQQERLRLFETGLVFHKGKQLTQKAMLSGVVAGSVYPEQWAEPARETTFYDVKADIEALFCLAAKQNQLRFNASSHPALHPGQCADVYITQNKGENVAVGRIGSLYPELKQRLGINHDAVLFEIELNALLSREIPVFEPVSKYPAIRRDLAILVEESITAQMVGECVKKNTSNLLKKFQLFDEYKGKGIDSGRKSLAFSITLQDHDRTLVDTEVDTIIAKVISALEQELGGTLRK